MRKPLIIFVLVALFIGVSCDTEEPDSIFDPNATAAPDPVITSVIPPDSAFAIVEDITIIGKNFKSTPEDNFVYFDGNLATIVTADTNKLVVKSPDIIGDSILIQMTVNDAWNFAYYERLYTLNPIAIEYGQLDEYNNMKAITCDQNENVYVTSDNIIYIVKPDSIKTQFAELMSVAATAMKIGPSGYIYYCQSIAMFRMSSEGVNDASWYIIFPEDVNDFDFDNEGNMYVGSAKGVIYTVDIDNKLATAQATQDSVEISSVRVYGSDLYIAGSYKGTNPLHIKNGVWRYHITSGILGDSEQYLNWDDYDDSKINSITFSEDGDLYLSSTGDDCITVYSNGEFEPLYEGALYPNTTKLCWGNGKYLYAIRLQSDDATQRLIRINMQKNGAPYYGRTL